MRMICSLFITITVLRPLVDLRLPSLDDITLPIHSSAESAAYQGNAYRIRSVSGIIKSELEAYILKEAEAQGAAVTAEIILDSSDPPLPVAVIIRGSFDAGAEAALSKLLMQELGIPKEHQTWIRQELNASADY